MNTQTQHPQQRNNHPAIAYLNTARKAAHEVHRACPYQEYQELEAIAFFWLLKLWSRYDPSKGLSMSVYLLCRIKGKLLHEIRDRGSAIRKPRTEYDLHQRARHLERKLRAGGETPSTRELAERLGVEPAKLYEATQTIANCQGLRSEILARSLPASETPQVIAIDDSLTLPIDKEAFRQILFNGKTVPKIAESLGLTTEELLVRVRRYFARVVLRDMPSGTLRER